MARLPRLSLARVAHLVLLRGHNGEAVFRDDEDRQAFLEALQGAFEREQVDLHAYALLADRCWLLCTPVQDQGWGLLSHLALPGGGKLGVYEPRHARPKPMTA